MGSPPNCLAPGNQHDGAESISLCVRCYDNIEVTTEAEKAVIRAAVAVAVAVTSMSSDAIEDRIDVVCIAVDALLAAEPEWGE
jgi:hypothetical protein